MAEPTSTAENLRPADVARLELAKFRVQEGVKLEDVFQKITEAAATVLNVERAGIWLFVDERRALRCVNLYELSKNEHSAGATLQVDDFPGYFEALARRKTIPAEVAGTDPRTNDLAEAYLKPLGITSLLDAPIYVGGDVVGVVCHEHIGPTREWTTEDRDFAGSMADMVALKIRAAEIEDARIALHTQAAQLAEARRLDSLAAMAAGIAHDFNNILTLVIGGAELILMNPSAADRVCELANKITSAGRRGTSLAQELMSFARPGPKSARVVRPADVVSAQQTLLQSAAGDRHTVAVQVRSAAGRVLIAADQLERVVMNLVVNARDAMPDGGAIGVSVDLVEGRFESNQWGWFVVLEVADKGTGISPDVLEKVFDPFFTTKPRGQGTGLGLAVVNQIVTHAGGFVKVQTQVGEGTTVRVFLPRVSSQT